MGENVYSKVEWAYWGQFYIPAHSHRVLYFPFCAYIGIMEQFRTRLNDYTGSGGGRSNRPQTWRDNMTPDFKSNCPSLSYETRIWGFLSCVFFGMVLSGFSTLFVATGRLQAFAIFYTLGSIAGLLSTTFIIGPCRQFSLMFAKTRWLASLIYLLSIAGTLAAVYVVKADRFKVILALACVAVQFLAAFWYGLSYIPYGRTVVRKMLAFTFCGDSKALDV